MMQKSVLLLLGTLAVSRADPYFWHLTDIHLDPNYGKTGAVTSCNKQVQSPGRYGDYECDAPYQLVKASLKAMVNHGREPEFILYTGDTPGHMTNYTELGWNTNTVITFLQNITDLFKETFPDVTFVMTLGNHDYYPKSKLPGETNAIYEAAANMWGDWLNETAAKNTFKNGGYYTRLLNPAKQLRVVVLNSHLYAKDNDVTQGQSDPGGQYAWLETTLTAARTARERVHLVLHTPLGVFPSSSASGWLREDDNTKLTDIIAEFSDVIMGAYTAHEHFDTFRIFYKDGKPGTVMFVAPSVTPWRSRFGDNQYGAAHNPGVRKVFFDKIDGYLSDIEQFYLNLPTANGEDQEASWLPLYSFKRLYGGVNNVTAPVLHQLVQTFNSYGNNDFHNYYDFHSANAKHSSNVPCSCHCKYLHTCSMVNVKYSDFHACYSDITCKASTLSPSLAFLFFFIISFRLM